MYSATWTFCCSVFLRLSERRWRRRCRRSGVTRRWILGLDARGERGSESQRRDEMGLGGGEMGGRRNARLGVGLGTLGLGGDLAPDDELPDVVGLLQVEEATDLGRALNIEKRKAEVLAKRSFSLSPFLGRHLSQLKSKRTLGPSLLGRTWSVKPGMSFSPCLTMTSARALTSAPTMHPRTDLRFLSPSRRER